jgi:hypothetical protein
MQFWNQPNLMTALLQPTESTDKKSDLTLGECTFVCVYIISTRIELDMNLIHRH